MGLSGALRDQQNATLANIPALARRVRAFVIAPATLRSSPRSGAPRLFGEQLGESPARLVFEIDPWLANSYTAKPSAMPQRLNA